MVAGLNHLEKSERPKNADRSSYFLSLARLNEGTRASSYRAGISFAAVDRHSWSSEIQISYDDSSDKRHSRAP